MCPCNISEHCLISELMVFDENTLNSSDDYEYIVPKKYVYCDSDRTDSVNHLEHSEPSSGPEQQAPAHGYAHTRNPATVPVARDLNKATRKTKPPKPVGSAPPESSNKMPPAVAPKPRKNEVIGGQLAPLQLPESTTVVQSVSLQQPSPPSPATRPSPLPAVTPHSGYSDEDEPVYGSINEIPDRIDTLSVREVSSCLRLLNLGQYAHMFMENDVDGCMLQDMTEEMMKETFKMSSFHSLKLYKFIGGYRPRVGQVPK